MEEERCIDLGKFGGQLIMAARLEKDVRELLALWPAANFSEITEAIRILSMDMEYIDRGATMSRFAR